MSLSKNNFFIPKAGSTTRPSKRLKFTIPLVAGVWIPAYYPIPPGINNLALQGEVVGFY
jgi:hypothetical protein